jgi:hypothetical protein
VPLVPGLLPQAEALPHGQPEAPLPLVPGRVPYELPLVPGRVPLMLPLEASTAMDGFGTDPLPRSAPQLGTSMVDARLLASSKVAGGDLTQSSLYIVWTPRSYLRDE